MNRRRQRARSLLARLQLGLEALYRVETRLAIDAFVIDAVQRGQMQPARAPREQLLLREMDGELGMALFVDAAAIANLERHDPAARLDERNFADFCLAVEGVSHFVYVALAAARQRPVSQLELELQAEVDKFVCCFLVGGVIADLRLRLYGDVRYAAALERRFTTRAETGGLLAEVRRFYRMDLPDKLGRIAQLG